MEAIRILMNEHRVIERVLESLEAFADRILADQSSEQELLSDYVRFIREFADATHHAKEEKILFEAMGDAGFSREIGPVAVMMAEHDEGRKLVATMSTAAEKKTPWDDADRRSVATAALRFVDLLRHHIMKEDNILYPMAEAQLAPGQRAQVDSQCLAHEDQHAAGTASLRKLAASLSLH